MKKLPKTVYNMVVAIVSDYERMKKMLDKGEVTNKQAVLFTRYVAAVDDALVAVCAGEDPNVRVLLRTDISERNGFENSRAMSYYTKCTYDRRKSDAIFLIAQMLDLV